jgi:cytochrome c553
VHFRLLAPLALLTLPVVLSCGQGGAAPGPATAQSEAVAAPVHVPWVEMNRGQRIDYMVKTVLPKMKAEFVAFDAKRFARMDCATCHGDGVADGTFMLPNPKLPKLLENDLFAKHQHASPAITKFMLEKVEPEVAALLEIPDFDPATRKGMSCYNCHTREVDPTKPVPPPAEHH